MANADKDILITPGKDQAIEPTIVFTGDANAPITLTVKDDNTLSFEAPVGQLMSINDTLNSGSIFSVNDIAGLPQLAVDHSGRIDLVRYGGYVRIGNTLNENASDVKLAVVGEMAVTAERGSTTPASIHFSENEDLSFTSTWPASIIWDGPNYNDNNNYWGVQTAGSDRLSVTYGGGVGVHNINPQTKLQIIGGHGDSSFRLTYDRNVNTGSHGGTGYNTMHFWVSEPGRTWDGGGIGLNVTNFYTQIYPTTTSDSSLSYFPRINDQLGQAYIRFFPGSTVAGYSGDGHIDFTTTNTDATTYASQIQIKRGCLQISATQNDSYKLHVGGNINFTGLLYQNGVEFSSIPPQSDSTRGAYIRSDGTDAYWDTNANSLYSGATVVRGYSMAGYKSSVAFKNVNRTDHASDTSYDLGDRITTSDAYTAGASDGTYAFVFHSGDNWNVNGNEINRFNMVTDSNSDISTTMTTSMNRTSAMRSKFLYAYTFGNGEPNKFNLLTQTSSGTGWAATDGGGNLRTGNPACGSGELRGWHKAGSAGSYVEFATETRNSWSSPPGTNGFSKTISTYTGFMYWNDGSGYRTPTAMSKRKDYDGSQITTIAKFADSGEETFHTGELKGYMVGMYNGAQNNTGAIMNYQTNTYYTQSSVNSQGTTGRASGAGVEYGRGI